METATGSFVLLYEWVLQWQKMGPCLTSQEKEKIDKCKKQVGKLGMREHSTQELEWEDQIKVIPKLRGKLEASLGYISPCLRFKNERKTSVFVVAVQRHSLKL